MAQVPQVMGTSASHGSAQVDTRQQLWFTHLHRGSSVTTPLQSPEMKRHIFLSVSGLQQVFVHSMQRHLDLAEQPKQSGKSV